MLPLLALRWPSPVDSLADDLARLVVDHADVDGTGKRKANGSKQPPAWVQRPQSAGQTRGSAK
eukprot:2312396-Prymnesium_polylepis.1